MIRKDFIKVGTIFEYVGAVYLGIVFILFTFLFISDLITVFGYFRDLSIKLRYISLTISMVLSIFAFYLGNKEPSLREEKVFVPIAELSGIRMVLISDLHIGIIKNKNYLKVIQEKVNNLDPDLVFITGDLLDSESINEESLIPILKSFKAKYGIYGVLGNHEYYVGKERSKEFYKKGGITLLENEGKEPINNLLIIGIEDLTVKRSDLNYSPLKIVSNIVKEKEKNFKILLSHSPLNVENFSKKSINLMLSGHTHNGQIWPFTYLSMIFYPYNYGRFRIGKMDLIVTRGAGTWGPPMRLFKPSEVVLVEFVHENSL